MAKTDLHMPKFGMTMTEGTITEWHKKVGDKVIAGETLLSVETEKVVTEVDAPCSGTLASVLFGEGDEVPVGEVIAVIED